MVCKEPNEACKIIEQEKADLRGALDDMRDYVHHLRPSEIENKPLIPLIQHYINRFSERTGLVARLNVTGKPVRTCLPPIAWCC